MFTLFYKAYLAKVMTKWAGGSKSEDVKWEISDFNPLQFIKQNYFSQSHKNILFKTYALQNFESMKLT